MLSDSLPGPAVRLDQLLRVVVDRTAHPSAARQFRAAAAGLTPARHGAVGMFAAVGLVAFAVDTGVFAGLKTTVLAPAPVAAKLVAVLTATVVGYLLNQRWTFRTRSRRRRGHEVLLYVLISGLGLLVSVVPLYASRDVLHLTVPVVSWRIQEVTDFLSAQLLGTGLATAFRYWTLNRYAFPAHSAALRPRHRLRIEA